MTTNELLYKYIVESKPDWNINVYYATVENNVLRISYTDLDNNIHKKFTTSFLNYITWLFNNKQ